MTMSWNTLQNLLEACFEAGNAYSSTAQNPIRIARREDGSYYASQTERRSDYGDTTVAFIDCWNRDYASVATEVADIIAAEMRHHEDTVEV